MAYMKKVTEYLAKPTEGIQDYMRYNKPMFNVVK